MTAPPAAHHDACPDRAPDPTLPRAAARRVTRSPRVRPRRFLLAAHAALLAGALAPAAARTQRADGLGTAVDAIFRPVAGAARPGCAVGVSRAGTPVLERAYGMADLEHDVANTPTTVFEAGSVTKQVTAGAVVLLAQEGKLSLDDDVRRYVPELPDYGARITLRHLLNHTSGLRDWGSVAALAGWPRTSRVYTNDLALRIAARQRTLNYPPGAHYSYTNTGYNLLALIVGRVSGTPLAEFTRARFFAPLGMTRTSWRDDFTRVVKARAVAYAPAGGGTWRMDMPFENAHGNGGLLTTVSDLLRWTRNLETGAVGGAGWTAEMHRPGRLTDGRVLSYASGLVVAPWRGVPEVAHSGATAGYRAFVSRYPAQGVAVAVLCNDASAGAPGLAHAVAEVALGDALAPRPADGVAPAPVSGAAAARLAGRWRGTREGQLLRLVVQDGGLRTGSGTPVVAVDAHRYRLGAPGGSELETDSSTVADGRPALRLRRADGDTERLEPVPDAAPTPAQLAAYAGTYASDEVEATLVVEVAPGGAGLRLRDGYGRPLDALAPVYPDGFDGDDYRLRFDRDAAGRITALRVHDARAWDVRFERRPAATPAPATPAATTPAGAGSVNAPGT